MNQEQRRWPDHRKLEEKRISDLEAEVSALQLRIRNLEDELSGRHGKPPPHDDAPPDAP